MPENQRNFSSFSVFDSQNPSRSVVIVKKCFHKQVSNNSLRGSMLLMDCNFWLNTVYDGLFNVRERDACGR